MGGYDWSVYPTYCKKAGMDIFYYQSSLCVFCILVVTDKKETWGEKAVWGILMILKIIDIAGQIRDGIF